jgi:dolichyl-phosphate beta-glucosyltransferase
MPEEFNTDKTPYLSIVIPAFNEAERLPATLGRIGEFAEALDFPTEVIVVDNASTDATKEVIMDYRSRYPFIIYYLGTTPGKGAALRTGIMASRGDYLLICDADLAVPIEEVGKFLPPQLQDYDIAIGSREAEGAKRYDEPVYRHFMGRVFNVIVRALLLPGILDTQCGFKCFRRDVAQELFSAGTINGWSFDVEILYIARLRGCRIIEVPVNWYYGEKSKVSPVRDTMGMFKEVLAIRKNWGGGR